MQTIAKYDDLNIPTWALNYLVNGDSEGLNSGEIAEINKWTMSFEPLDPKASFLLSTEQEEFFTWHPEFGKAATCVTGTVVIAK